MIYKNLVQKISIPADRKTKQKDYLLAGQLPIIDQGKKLIGGYSNDLTKTISCDLPVIVFGDHTKVVKYISFPFGAGADGIKILKPKENIFPKYLYYATQYLTLKMEDKGYARHYQHLEKKDLSVPPLEEQQRIVARIEELFSELDAAVATLERTKEQLAVYRQAVLKEAFESIPSECYLPFKNIILETPQNGLYKSKSYYSDNGTRILRIDGFYNGFLVKNYEYKRVVLTSDEEAKYQLNVNDLVLNRVNSMSHLGKCALIRHLDEKTVFESNVMRIKLNSELVDVEYLTYYLSYSGGKKELTKNAKQAVNQASINQKDVGNALIPLPPLDVQRNKLQEIESRLSVCDKIEETVTTALREAEAMRQSILKQAFAGEL